jgi:hypothetical protein
MVGIVTKGLVYDYLVENPGATPRQIAKGLDAPLYAVNKRLLNLLYNRAIDRKEAKPKIDFMFYYPVKK